jgi:acetyl-CoA carboxylase biotin carboxyl carrier protein
MSAEHEEPREEQPMADARPAGEAWQAEPAELVEPAEPAAVEPAEPVAVGPGDPVGAHRPDGGEGPATTVEEAANRPDGEDASLLALVDRLAAVLEHSDLGELEVAAGGTTIILRAPSAIERTMTLAGPTSAAEGPAAPAGGVPAQAPAIAPAAASAPAATPAVRPSVKAPLTGIFYGAPSPGATAYVAVGDHVSVGQIIGLIEAMKLFNEIKSDLAGRVVRVCADNGALVKARQPLIEVEPA